MTQFGMFGKLTTDPQNRDTLVGILTQAATFLQSDDECQMYIVNKDADDDGAVWVIELWQSKEAHDQSLTRPEIRHLIEKALPILKDGSQSVTVIPVGGKGL